MDMLTGSSIQMKAGERLRVVYGEEAFVQQHTLPQRIALGTAYPNPLSMGQTLTVPFSLPESSQQHQVELSVYDLRGRKLVVLAQGAYPAGHHQVGWQGQSGGASLTTGLYLYRLSVAGKWRLRRRKNHHQVSVSLEVKYGVLTFKAIFY